MMIFDTAQRSRRWRLKNWDYYTTPAPITEALLEVEDFGKDSTIWEPACGKGDISEVLQAHGYNVISTDIEDRGYGEQGDFLTTVRECDHIITNPPYQNNAYLMFAMRSLFIARKKVALLLPIFFLDRTSRTTFLDNSPLKCVYVFTYRIHTLKDGGTGKPARRHCFGWFVWDKSWQGRTPELRFLRPSKIFKLGN